EAVVNILEVCDVIGISIITLFAFSKENWKRSPSEINDLMELFRIFFINEFEKLKKRNVKIIHSGIKDDFDHDIQSIIDIMIEQTKDNKRSILNLAINYSGRSEIIEGIKNLTKRVLEDRFDVNQLTENNFNQFLFHPDFPEPDLLIRTSGEKRISNFLLWQIAYTELYFTEILWPEFTKKDFVMAISEYQKRERRFGGRLG
ncbi:MAG: polyprenyl diphosphate synthase, partial [Spirochaetota bacterium]|nr:polyprenyl diphosphate synthase [Spirochaetota bacterium]